MSRPCCSVAIVEAIGRSCGLLQSLKLEYVFLGEAASGWIGWMLRAVLEFTESSLQLFETLFLIAWAPTFSRLNLYARFLPQIVPYIWGPWTGFCQTGFDKGATL